MVLAATYVQAPAVSPLPFGLLDVAEVVTGGDPHVGMGLNYEPEFCGAAWPTVGMCVDPPSSAGTASVSVTAGRVATITGTGEPAGSTYVIDWGDGQVDSAVALDGQTNTYAGNGEYVVTVTNTANGYTARIPISVTGSTSGPYVANASFAKNDDDGVAIVVGEPFAVYHMQHCRTVGRYSDAQARARRSLELGEGRAVEMAMAARLAAAAVDVTPTPGTAVDIVDGLALLERYAGINYGGVPTIHAPRDIALMLASRNAVLRLGDHLESVLGSKVAAGAGYEGDVGPIATTAGASWVFATGTVLLHQGNIIESGPQIVTTPPAAPGGGFGSTNEYRALAERPYVGAWECFVAGIQVKTTSCCV